MSKKTISTTSTPSSASTKTSSARQNRPPLGERLRAGMLEALEWARDEKALIVTIVEEGEVIQEGKLLHSEVHRKPATT